MCRKNLFKCGLTTGIISTSAQVAGVISYTIIANVKYSDCPSTFTQPDQPTLCSDNGLNLGLAAAATYLLNLLLYLCCGTIMKRRIREHHEHNQKTHVNNSGDHGKNVTTHGKSAWN